MIAGAWAAFICVGLAWIGASALSWLPRLVFLGVAVLLFGVIASRLVLQQEEKVLLSRILEYNRWRAQLSDQ